MLLSRNAAGTRHLGPLYTRRQNPGQNLETVDMVRGWNPSEVVDGFDDFLGSVTEHEVVIPIGTIATTGASNGVNVVRRGGYVTSAYLVASEALAAHDTNYLTFTLVNKLGSGSGSTAMLAVSDLNTTKATGGVAITAKAAYALTLHGTAANLRVNAGDTLEGIATSAATLAGDVEDAVIVVRIAAISPLWTPRVTRTAGSPLVGPVADTVGGEIIAQLSATSEANVAGFDFGDRLALQGNKQPFWEARVKVSGVAANTRFVFGLASAFTATLDDITRNAWFRLEGNSLALLVEADDGTTDTDDQPTGLTLVADTYYRLGIALMDLGRIGFFVDGQQIGGAAVSAGALTTGLFQPVAYLQKSTGTGAQTFTVDYVRWGCNRR